MSSLSLDVNASSPGSVFAFAGGPLFSRQPLHIAQGFLKRRHGLDINLGEGALARADMTNAAVLMSMVISVLMGITKPCGNR